MQLMAQSCHLATWGSGSWTCLAAVSRTHADLVIDLGHVSDNYAWKGVEILAKKTGKQVLHVQHMLHTASMIYCDATGQRGTCYAVADSYVSTDDGFWYGWTIRDL
jgi:hypothetical protein